MLVAELAAVEVHKMLMEETVVLELEATVDGITEVEVQMDIKEQMDVVAAAAEAQALLHHHFLAEQAEAVELELL